MDPVISAYVLLCEDQQIAAFTRRFLKKRGVKPHQLRECIAPSGAGSAEQWVRERYPWELKAIRKRTGIMLVVGTDADTLTVEQRIKTLDEACKKQGIAERKPDEPILMVVPKRSIETWLAYLREETPVDEITQYPRYAQESDCRKQVERLDEGCRKANLPVAMPSSLETACKTWNLAQRSRTP